MGSGVQIWVKNCSKLKAKNIRHEYRKQGWPRKINARGNEIDVQGYEKYARGYEIEDLKTNKNLVFVWDWGRGCIDVLLRAYFR